MNLNTYMQSKAETWTHYSPKKDNTQPFLGPAVVNLALVALDKRRQYLKAEVQRLQKFDPVNATVHYRRNKDGWPTYMYLVHPQVGGKRKREYIGIDQKKRLAALKRVGAHRRIVAMEHDLNAIATRLDLITRLLLRCLRVAIDGHT